MVAPMNRTNSGQFALLCTIAVFALLNGSTGVGQDWLGPEFEQPLPQYESTTAPRPVESPISNGKTPGSRSLNSDLPAANPLPATPTRMMNSTGTELAPNPLKSLLEGRQPTLNSTIKPLPPKPSTVREPISMPPTTSATTAEPPRRILPKPRRAVSAKKLAPSKKKQPVAAPKKPVLGYDIYRDTSVFPLDHRKPNNPCTQGSNCGCSNCRLPGINGKPFKPTEPGGYNCGKNCPHKRPKFSVYWPRPFSAKLDERNPARAAARYSGRQTKKIVDAFDCLANFQLLSYERVDNGYTGRESDPYGCLGESKIAGLGFRPPGTPNNPSQPVVGYSGNY